MVTCLYTPRPPLYPEVLRGHDLLSSCVHVSSLVFQYRVLRVLWAVCLMRNSFTFLLMAFHYNMWLSLQRDSEWVPSILLMIVIAVMLSR